MQKKLELGRSALLDPVEIYVRTIEGKVNEVEAKKQAFINALAYGYAPMDKVHN